MKDLNMEFSGLWNSVHIKPRDIHSLHSPCHTHICLLMPPISFHPKPPAKLLVHSNARGWEKVGGGMGNDCLVGSGFPLGVNILVVDRGGGCTTL